jgi:hypothetical protein
MYPQSLICGSLPLHGDIYTGRSAPPPPDKRVTESNINVKKKTKVK